MILKKLFTLIILVSCSTTFAQTKKANFKADSTKTLAPFKQKDTIYWVENFREFRDAIFQRNKAKAKVFFNFPINDFTQSIKQLVYDEDPETFQKSGNSIYIFTETDFSKYFDKIFPKNFVKSLLKVKTDELYKKGTYEIKFKEGFTTYTLHVIFDKITNTLELQFNSDTEHKDEKGELLDDSEFSIIYYFEITKQGHIKFKEIRIAG
jgi:hypothetical protein